MPFGQLLARATEGDRGDRARVPGGSPARTPRARSCPGGSVIEGQEGEGGGRYGSSSVTLSVTSGNVSMVRVPPREIRWTRRSRGTGARARSGP